MAVHQPWRTAVHNGGKWLIVAATVCAMALIALAALAVHQELSGDNKPYNPLGTYSLQQIENTVPGVDGPAVRLGADAIVTAQKCNNTDRPVRVRVVIEWAQREPHAGATVEALDDFAAVAPGCEELTFANPIPEVVAQRAIATKDLTGTNTVWQQVGTETPYDRDGQAGTPKAWESENFTIVVP